MFHVMQRTYSITILRHKCIGYVSVSRWEVHLRNKILHEVFYYDVFRSNLYLVKYCVLFDKERSVEW